MSKVQYNCFSCPSFPLLAFDPLLFKPFDALITDHAKFFKRTPYLDLGFIFKPDGASRGSDESTFAYLPDISYLTTRGTLIVSVKIPEPEWKGLRGRDLDPVFKRKMIEALIHLCTIYRLDWSSVELELLKRGDISEPQLASLKTKVSGLSYKKTRMPKGKRLEIHIRMSEWFGTEQELASFNDLELKIDDRLRESGLGKVSENQIGAGCYSIFCDVLSKPNKAVDHVRDLLAPFGSAVSIAIE